jgi:tRNA N6-adenosine threonylcarbamoyltransferase
MLILGIETSCDETSAAVVEDGKKILSNVVSSQVELHAAHGGVVPELASRQHLRLIGPVVSKALEEAGVEARNLDALAVTYGPGLPSALLVGLSAAKGLAMSLGKPLIPINHLEAHLYSPFVLTETPVEPSFIALIVSGGHSILAHASGYTSYRVLGQTVDDAAGEAFDKGARLLGLGYPGGPLVDKHARQGNRAAVAFPRGMLDSNSWNFSFSGVKTSLAYHVKKNPGFHLADICASYQEAIVEVLVEKAVRAAEALSARAVAASGGVSCNTRFRERLKQRCDEAGLILHVAPPNLCTDNAGMIAALAFHRRSWPVDSASVDIAPNLKL